MRAGLLTEGDPLEEGVIVWRSSCIWKLTISKTGSFLESITIVLLAVVVMKQVDAVVLVELEETFSCFITETGNSRLSGVRMISTWFAGA